MSIVACPRHGIVDVAKDQPCPECGVAAYDLADLRRASIASYDHTLQVDYCLATPGMVPVSRLALPLIEEIDDRCKAQHMQVTLSDSAGNVLGQSVVRDAEPTGMKFDDFKSVPASQVNNISVVFWQ